VDKRYKVCPFPGNAENFSSFEKTDKGYKLLPEESGAAQMQFEVVRAGAAGAFCLRLTK
jgi:hypothetical protein